MIKANNGMVVTVNNKAKFDKAFNVTFRGTQAARDMCNAISSNNFFKQYSASYELCAKFYKKSAELSKNLHDTAAMYKVMSADTESDMLEFVTQSVYDAYAYGTDSKKTTRYNVFATAVIDWFHSIGFTVDKKTVDYIALSVGMNVNTSKNFVITGNYMKAVSPKTFARKFMYSVSDVFGDSVKVLSVADMQKIAKLEEYTKKNGEKAWRFVKIKK